VKKGVALFGEGSPQNSRVMPPKLWREIPPEEELIWEAFVKTKSVVTPNPGKKGFP